MILEHDVDALVLQALIEISPDWAPSQILQSIASMLETNIHGQWWIREGIKPSLWNIVPRAQVLARFSHNPLVTKDTQIHEIERAIFLSQDGDKKRPALFKILRNYYLLQLFSGAHILFGLSFLVTAVILVLYIRG